MLGTLKGVPPWPATVTGGRADGGCPAGLRRELRALVPTSSMGSEIHASAAAAARELIPRNVVTWHCGGNRSCCCSAGVPTILLVGEDAAGVRFNSANPRRLLAVLAEIFVGAVSDAKEMPNEELCSTGGSDRVIAVARGSSACGGGGFVSTSRAAVASSKVFLCGDQNHRHQNGSKTGKQAP